MHTVSIHLFLVKFIGHFNSLTKTCSIELFSKYAHTYTNKARTDVWVKMHLTISEELNIEKHTLNELLSLLICYLFRFIKTKHLLNVTLMRVKNMQLFAYRLFGSKYKTLGPTLTGLWVQIIRMREWMCLMNWMR